MRHWDEGSKLGKELFFLCNKMIRRTILYKVIFFLLIKGYLDFVGEFYGY